jgi:RimJ/RimL family protein N-acetyltransferase
MAFGPSYVARLPDASPLVLRPPTAHELDELLPTPEEVSRYGGTVEPSIFFDDCAADDLMAYLGDDPGVDSWGLEAYRQIVGITGIIHRDPYPDGFVFIMNPNFWQKGIGSRARTVATSHAFAGPQQYQAARAYAHTANIASGCMLATLGFCPVRAGTEEEWQAFLLPSPYSSDLPPEFTPDQAEWSRQRFLAKLGECAIRLL